MIWRVRLARGLLRHDYEWMVAPTEMIESYTRIILEEAQLRQLIARTPHLSEVLTLLPPRKRERLH